MKFFTVEERKKLLVEELSRIIEVIKEEYDPEKIIVFGSMPGNNIHESREDRSQPVDIGHCFKDTMPGLAFKEACMATTPSVSKVMMPTENEFLDQRS
jgi:hypothetical protein